MSDLNSLATLVIAVILGDLMDRHTIGDELGIICHDDPEIWREITSTLIAKVQEVLEGASESNGKTR